MSKEEYYHWAEIDDGWICPKCNKECLPFHNVSTLSSASELNCSSVFSSSSASPLSHPSLSPHQLSVFYFNARSLLPKIDELRTLCLTKAYDIIVITETWLSSSITDSEISIPGYSTVRQDRNRHGGGVAVYLGSRIPYRQLYHPHKDLELIMLECPFDSQTFTVCDFYCPPNAPAACLDLLYDALSSLGNRKFSNVLVCGDFNIDVSKPNYNQALKQIQEDFCLSL